MATAAKHITPTFTEQARAKRLAAVQNIVDVMSPAEIVDMTYRLLATTLPDVSDELADAIHPVCIAFEDHSCAIDNAVEADEYERFHSADRRA